MKSLPTLDLIEHEELLMFIENNEVIGKGLDLVDVHLMAAAALAGIPSWTQDRKLNQVCTRLNIDFLLH